MTNIEVISFTASVASLILAVVAIVLSIVFYIMSNKNSHETTKASEDIASTVERLEILFDKLYNGIFGMVQETNSDIRKHIWPETVESSNNLNAEFESKAEEKIIQLRRSMDHDLSKMLEHQKVTDENLNEIQGRISKLLDKAIDNSRKIRIETKNETIREGIIKAIQYFQEKRTSPTAKRIISYVTENYDTDSRGVVTEIFEMIERNLLIKTGGKHEIDALDIFTIAK